MPSQYTRVGIITRDGGLGFLKFMSQLYLFCVMIVRRSMTKVYEPTVWLIPNLTPPHLGRVRVPISSYPPLIRDYIW